MMGDNDIRIGLDFGTSTTLTAVRIGPSQPRVLRLEPASEEMPSYLAVSPDGMLVGTAAKNSGISAHSIKLLLAENRPIDELECMRPTDAATVLVAEAVHRTLEALKRDGRLPPTAERLEVVTHVGCTPRFDLTARTLLRDVCREAGLTVSLVDLVEEPVAAAFEVAYSGLGEDGPTMVIDIGGGTLDVAVLEVNGDGSSFVIHATGGVPLGGDQFTLLVVDELRRRIRSLAGEDVVLSRQAETALWNRAEAAKVALSSADEVRVALPIESDADTVITRQWFEGASSTLLARIEGYVTSVYREARLTLHRGAEHGEGDWFPGTTVLRYGDNGEILERVERLSLDDDGRRHLRNVYLLGGASKMPLLRARFEKLLGDVVRDTEQVGLDPVHAIVRGLARHQDLERVDMRYPNWGVKARVRKPDGSRVACEVYEPWAPAFRIDHVRGTRAYAYRVRVPTNAGGGLLMLSFRPVARTHGEEWEWVELPVSGSTLTFTVDLFGRVSLRVDDTELYPGRTAPFASEPPTPWFPPGWRDSVRRVFIDDRDWRHDTV